MKRFILLTILIVSISVLTSSCYEYFEGLESNYGNSSAASNEYGTIIVESSMATTLTGLYGLAKMNEVANKANDANTVRSIQKASLDYQMYYIYVDSEYKGENSAKIKYLYPGAYTVKIVNKFTKDIKLNRTVRVQAGETITVRY